MIGKINFRRLLCSFTLAIGSAAAIADGNVLLFNRDPNGVVQDVLIWDSANTQWVTESLTLENPTAYIVGDGFLIVEVQQNTVLTYGWIPGATSLASNGVGVVAPASVQTIPNGSSLAVIPIAGNGERQPPLIWAASMFGYVPLPVTTKDYGLTPLGTDGFAAIEADSGNVTVRYWTSGSPQSIATTLTDADGVQLAISSGDAALAVLEDKNGIPLGLVGFDGFNGVIGIQPVALTDYHIQKTEAGFVVLDVLPGSGACLYAWSLPGVAFMQTCVSGDISFSDALVTGSVCMACSPDTDCDADVDIYDFDRFSQQFTGPTQP